MSSQFDHNGPDISHYYCGGFVREGGDDEVSLRWCRRYGQVWRRRKNDTDWEPLGADD